MINENPGDASTSDSNSISVVVKPDKKKKNLRNELKNTSVNISVKDFLDFLKTAYQVNESIENIMPDLMNKNKSIDWDELANNKLVNDLMVQVENNHGKIDSGSSTSSNRVDAGCQTIEIDLVVKHAARDNEAANKNYQPPTPSKENIVDKSSLQSKNKKSLPNKITDNSDGDTRGVSDVIKEKLNEVLSEGILDSVLPFIVPVTTHQPVIKKSDTAKRQENAGEKPEKDKPPSSSKESVSASKSAIRNESRKSSTIVCVETASAVPLAKTKSEPEVVIHVCDELKQLRKDFQCPQQLLISKMGYFAEVTTGQKLEDMDISVHCDVGIFDWLMRWVKKDSILPEDCPKLDSVCVIPVLVSAAFLQMEPLMQDCLLYCHAHMNEILRTSTNLGCLNDSIITRLAAMYTNTELEMIRDKKDKILSRLYCKMIMSLGEPVPQSLRGHWASLACLYRCSKCNKLVTKLDGQRLPCVPSCMRIDQWGEIASNHVKDISWNLSEHITKLHHEFKTWRRVYWRLWADCHFLHCLDCDITFPAHQMGWCCYHPEPAQFFSMDNQRSTPIPVGRYPCCGERAYRFEALKNYGQGCQFKEHTVDISNARDYAIISIFSNHRSTIEQEPPQLIFPEKITRLVAKEASSNFSLLSNKEIFWWEGIELAPPREKLGLLGKMCINSQTSISSKDDKRYMPGNQSDSTYSDSGDDDEYEDLDDNASDTSYWSTTSDFSGDSTPSPKPPQLALKTKLHKRKCKKRIGAKKGMKGRHWSPNLSARSNQDLQRGFEEHAMRQITDFLSKRTSGSNILTATRSCTAHRQLGSIWNHHITPTGGIYVRLEAEWKELLNQQQQQQASNATAQQNRPRNNVPTYLTKQKFRVHRI